MAWTQSFTSLLSPRCLQASTDLSSHPDVLSHQSVLLLLFPLSRNLFPPPRAPIPVSRGGAPSNGIWWNLFPAPQAASIMPSFLSKHSTSPLLEHPSYCDLNVSSLLIHHKTPRRLMAGTLSDPAFWRFASALNA